jgi:hypothetical protein
MKRLGADDRKVGAQKSHYRLASHEISMNSGAIAIS